MFPSLPFPHSQLILRGGGGGGGGCGVCGVAAHLCAGRGLTRILGTKAKDKARYLQNASLGFRPKSASLIFAMTDSAEEASP